jgi:hypothetical protein
MLPNFGVLPMSVGPAGKAGARTGDSCSWSCLPSLYDDDAVTKETAEGKDVIVVLKVEKSASRKQKEAGRSMKSLRDAWNSGYLWD